MKTTHLCASFAAALLTTLTALPARAGTDSAAPHSWRWPLHTPTRDADGNLALGRPRRLVPNGMGDFQELANPFYLHPGLDFIGSYVNDITIAGQTEQLPDLTVLPVDSQLVWIYDHDDCQGQSIPAGNHKAHCRMYFRTHDGKFLYYFGHVRYSLSPMPGEGEASMKLTAVMNSLLPNTAPTHGSYRCVGDCSFAEGDLGPTLTAFPGYDHLHFTIVDRKNNYDNVSPWKYLVTKSSTWDGTEWSVADEGEPVIKDVKFLPDDWSSSTPSVEVPGACGPEVSGKVDVAAEAYDVFRDRDTLDPPERVVPDVANQMAVHHARYSITQVLDDSTRALVQHGTWFNFSQGPMFCRGPNQGCGCEDPDGLLLCPADDGATSDNLYFQKYMVWGRTDTAEAIYGAPPMGLTRILAPEGVDGGYALTLYRHALSETSFNIGHKFAMMVFTDEWGTETGWTFPDTPTHTNWDTDAMASGLYEVTLEVADVAGHHASSTRQIRVNNALTGERDIWVADSADDVGVTPSPGSFDNSPDVLVITPEGDNGSTPRTTLSVDDPRLNQPYHVWVRVRYGKCNTTSGIKVALASVSPSTFGDQSTWRWIPGPTSGFAGPPGAPDGVTLAAGSDRQWIGPFDWTPRGPELGSDGQRLLVAGITSDDDAGSIDMMKYVRENNNVAQRTLQLKPAKIAPLLLADADGTWRGQSLVSNDSWDLIVTTFPAGGDIAGGDLDGDGHIEMVNGFALSENLVIIDHNGASVTSVPTNTNARHQAMAVGDIDGDHQAELIVGDAPGFTPTGEAQTPGLLTLWHFSSSGGAFSRTQMNGIDYFGGDGSGYYSPPRLGDFNNHGRVVACDFNQDGFDEIITMGVGPGPARIFTNRIHGKDRTISGAAPCTTWFKSPDSPCGSIDMEVDRLACADLNSDGYPELIVAHACHYLSGDCIGTTFEAYSYYDAPLRWSNASPNWDISYGGNVPPFGNSDTLAAGDLDGDGSAELIIQHSNPSATWVAVYSMRGKVTPTFFGSTSTTPTTQLARFDVPWIDRR